MLAVSLVRETPRGRFELVETFLLAPRACGSPAQISSTVISSHAAESYASRLVTFGE